MNYTLTEIFSFVAAVPALICLFKWRYMEPEYRPFALYTFIALLTEIIHSVSIHLWRTNVYSSNLYTLLEVMLLCWLFRTWGLFAQERVFKTLLGGILVAWLLEKLFLFSIHSFDSYVGIGFSLGIVLMSISTINRIIVNEKASLLRHPKFLACVAFIIYFTYDILVETFYIYGLNSSDHFRTKVFQIMVYVNLLSNLLFILASIWIPRKRAYSLL